MNSSTLAATEVSISHTGTNTAAVIKDICEDWQIYPKIVTVVTDNAANMRKAVSEDLNKHHHPCVAHTINLTVNDTLSADPLLTNILSKCRVLITHFKQSSVAAYKLKEKQTDLNLPQLVLKQDIVTRWNSTYIMIERLLRVQQPLCLALLELERAPENLTSTEWTILKDMQPVLKPFLELTEQLSAEKFVTMSMIVPLIRGLKHALRSVITSTDTGYRLQNCAIDMIHRRLGSLESNKMVAKATFLDPRFKKTAFGQDDNARNAQQWITDELIRLENQDIVNREEHPPVAAVSNNNEPDHNAGSGVSLWSLFDQKASEQRVNTTPSVTAIVMVRQYLETPLLERTKDPLLYWQDHAKTFPGLFTLAKKYLSIPATSVPSERLFSKAGYVLTDRRSRLTSEKLNEIIFLNNNLS